MAPAVAKSAQFKHGVIQRGDVRVCAFVCPGSNRRGRWCDS